GAGGVCAIRGTAVPTTARTEMMILTDLRMGPRILNDDSFVDTQPPLADSVAAYRIGEDQICGSLRCGISRRPMSAQCHQRPRRSKHTTVHVRFTPTVFSNSEFRCQALRVHPCRAHCSLHGRGLLLRVVPGDVSCSGRCGTRG